MAWSRQPARAVRIDRSHPRALGLLHDWTLHDGIERRARNLGKLGADGVFGVGSVAGTTGNYWSATPYGYGLRFDPTGTGTYDSLKLTVGDSGGSGSPGGSVFTIAADVQLAALVSDNGANEQGLYGSQTAGALTTRFSTTGKLQLVREQQALDAESTGTLTAGVRTHVAITYDGATARFYINGLASGSTAIVDTFTMTSQYVLGFNDNARALSLGSILWGVRVWNRALTAAELFAESKDKFGIYRKPPQSAFLRAPSKSRATLEATPAVSGGGFTTDGVPKGFNPGAGPTFARFWQSPLSNDPTIAAGAIGTADGVATAAFTGTAISAGDLVSAGVATAAFVTSTVGDLNSAGVATADFTGRSTAASVIDNSAGIAAADFTGRSTAATVLNGDGIATAAFTGRSTAETVLNGAGVATADFTGAQAGNVQSGALASDGSASTAFVGSFTGSAAATDAIAAGLVIAWALRLRRKRRELLDAVARARPQNIAEEIRQTRRVLATAPPVLADAVTELRQIVDDIAARRRVEHAEARFQSIEREIDAVRIALLTRPKPAPAIEDKTEELAAAARALQRAIEDDEDDLIMMIAA